MLAVGLFFSFGLLSYLGLALFGCCCCCCCALALPFICLCSLRISWYFFVCKGRVHSTKLKTQRVSIWLLLSLPAPAASPSPSATPIPLHPHPTPPHPASPHPVPFTPPPCRCGSLHHVRWRRWVRHGSIGRGRGEGKATKRGASTSTRWEGGGGRGGGGISVWQSGSAGEDKPSYGGASQTLTGADRRFRSITAKVTGGRKNTCFPSNSQVFWGRGTLQQKGRVCMCVCFCQDPRTIYRAILSSDLVVHKKRLAAGVVCTRINRSRNCLHACSVSYSSSLRCGLDNPQLLTSRFGQSAALYIPRARCNTWS